MNYQYPYYPQYSNYQSTQNNGIIWVQGEAGAKSYMVAPNTTVQLWDSEKQVIYLKSADASGMPSMKILDYSIRTEQSVNNMALNIQPDKSMDYALKSDLEALQQQIETLQKKLNRKEKRDESTLRNDE